MLNYNFIFKKSFEAKIDKVTIEREYWQLLFLQRLYMQPYSENIFFKGGTAIRFLLNSFRFSEDLDFTAIASRDKIESLVLKTFNFFKEKTPYHLEFKKEKVLRRFANQSLKYRFLFLPQNSQQKTSIRLDISFREKPIVKKQTVLIPFDYPIVPYPLVMHLGQKELLAEKVRALIIRGKPRDLFDFWFLLTKKIPLDEKIIKEKFKIYKNIKFSREKLKKTVSNYDVGELKKDLNQFLPENYRGFYKKLKGEVLELMSHKPSPSS